MYDRLTVAEAAERLGITKEAVRKRIHRGTLRSHRAQDGAVMVDVPPSGTPSSTPSGGAATDRDLLHEEMRERIAYLERQVEEEREARRRADTLLARLMDRVPELEAPAQQQPPSQASEEPAQDAATGAAGPRPQQADTGSQTGTEPQRPWWRRMFGG